MPSVFSKLRLTAQHLPLDRVEDLGLEVHGQSAWGMIMAAEEDAHSLRKPGNKYSDRLIGIRVLGFLLLRVAEQRERPLFSFAYHRLIKEIISCNRHVEGEPRTRDQRLQQLGLHYRNVMFRSFRSDTGPKKTPSRHVSRPSFDTVKQRILDTLVSQPAPTAPVVKRQALLRDGHRCVISGYWDYQSVREIPGVREQQVDPESEVDYTEVAHLFSQTASSDEEYLASALTFLEMFGLKDVAAKLSTNPNFLENVLTMTKSIHEGYDTFRFWLEEVPNMPHTYDVVSPDPLFWCTGTKPRRRITLAISARLTSDEQKNVKLPDRDLMALRAACAQVANMSGAVEQRDQILRDEEDIQVLASDGGDAEYLESLLRLRISQIPLVA